jgi:hypothetical protein
MLECDDLLGWSSFTLIAFGMILLFDAMTGLLTTKAALRAERLS